MGEVEEKEERGEVSPHFDRVLEKFRAIVLATNGTSLDVECRMNAVCAEEAELAYEN